MHPCLARLQAYEVSWGGGGGGGGNGGVGGGKNRARIVRDQFTTCVQTLVSVGKVCTSNAVGAEQRACALPCALHILIPHYALEPQMTQSS